MENSKENEIVNPAFRLEKLIGQFDGLLKQAGIAQVNQLLSQKKGPVTVLGTFTATIQEVSLMNLQYKYDEVIEIFAEIVANVEEEPWFSHIKIPYLPNVGHNNIDNLRGFINYVVKLRNAIQPLIDDEIGSSRKAQLFSAIESKKKTLDKGFFYEFTEGDLKRIQQIINELRDHIGASDLFEDGHRRRLLRRLEALQSEMHKKMSDVDRIWGLIGDAGIAIGKLGKDAKPFVDRIKELSQIAWKTQARAEELPSSSANPFLGDGEKI